MQEIAKKSIWVVDRGMSVFAVRCGYKENVFLKIIENKYSWTSENNFTKFKSKKDAQNALEKSISLGIFWWDFVKVKPKNEE